MILLKKIFEIYGKILIKLNNLQYLLPIVRNVVCKTNKLYNFTYYYYIIKILLILEKKLNFIKYIINIFNKKINKIRIDFYLNNKNHSIILVNQKTLLDSINTFNNFLNDYENNKDKIYYDHYCCKLSDITIKSNNNIIDNLNFNFIKNIITLFKGVDSDFNNFCDKEKYNISTKLVDILEMYEYNNNINFIEIKKIPPTIKKTFVNKDIQKLELCEIDN